MKRVLVTGFEPFGGETVNPALEAVKVLDGQEISGARIVMKSLPVVGHKCIEAIIAFIKEVDPIMVVAVGQAGGRPDICPERVAINVDDFRIKDNEGNQPVDQQIVPNGPTAYWNTLPIKAMVQTMRDGGVPASVSNSAGTYVCNHLFYGLMHYLASEGNVRRGGFLHIPYLPQQAAKVPGQPSLALDTIVLGLKLAIEAALVTKDDLKLSEGKTH